MSAVLNFFLATLFTVCIGVVIFCSLMLWRTSRVYGYRMRTLNQVSTAAKDDIQHHREWLWRYDAFGAVKYDDMLNEFWRPLDSFYTDKSFMKIGATKPGK